MSIEPPQNLVEHNPNPYKRSLGHIFNPEKGQWSTCPTLLKNWLIGVMMRRWENEWKSESPAAQWTLLWANSFTFYILHVSIQRAFWKHPCKTFMLYVEDDYIEEMKEWYWWWDIGDRWWILVVRMLRVIRMRMMRMLGVNPLQQRNGCSGYRPLRLVQTNIKCNFNSCVIWNLKFCCATVQCFFSYFYVKFEKLCTIVHLKICPDLLQIPFL